MRKSLPILIPVIVFFFIAGCETQPGKPLSLNLKFPVPKIKRMSQEQYGIDVKKMDVVQANFEQNQFLKDVLQEHNVKPEVIEDIARKSEQVFDVRRMKAGNPFTIIKDKEKVGYFIYEKNQADYVVFDLRDSVQIYEGRKKVVSQNRAVSGVIHSSLFETIQENGIDTKLARSLEEVFAWSVDFFHLEKGDFFKVIYTEEFVDGESIGVSEIQAAQFHHQDKDFFAINYTQDTLSDFYDEEGRSLIKAFLKSPLKYTKISSRYSQSRYLSAMENISKKEEDVEYPAPTGTPVYAVGDGVITKAKYRKGYGNYVKIKHGIYASQYMHMAQIAEDIESGAEVLQGQLIGFVGSSGKATNPSVRFRFWENGKIINPYHVTVPPAELINEQYREDFETVKDRMMTQLQKIKLIDSQSIFVSKD